MKLNPDYVRDILLYIEKNVDYNTETIPPKHNELWFGKIYKDEYFKNHEKQQLTEALNTMIEEEFIECAEPPRFIRKNLISVMIPYGMLLNKKQRKSVEYHLVLL